MVIHIVSGGKCRTVKAYIEIHRMKSSLIKIMVHKSDDIINCGGILVIKHLLYPFQGSEASLGPLLSLESFQGQKGREV